MNIVLICSYQPFFSILQSLLALNPKVPRYAKAVSTKTTKDARKHWKRNQDKSCSVSDMESHLHVLHYNLI